MDLDGNSNQPREPQAADPAHVQSGLILETGADTGASETVGIQSNLIVAIVKELLT